MSPLNLSLPAPPILAPMSVSPPPGPAPLSACLCHPLPPAALASDRQQGVPARIRCRWFSGYSVHRRVRWAWWHCSPHGLKLLLSAWFPLASSMTVETGALRWNSDLKSDVAGLWEREAHGSQSSHGQQPWPEGWV